MSPQPLPQPDVLASGAPHLTVVDDTTELPPVVEPTEPDVMPQDERDSSVAGNMTSWVRGVVTPPDIVTKHRPSLTDILTYGRENTQVPDNGALRVAARAWSYLALAQAARGYLRAWLWERATRVGIVLVLLTVFFLTPPGRVVLAGLTWIPFELHQIATHH